MKKLLVMLSIISILPLSAFAAPAAHAAGSSGNDVAPGGSDSCGLGWQVTDKKTMFGTTTRGWTNAIINPTFGMTSGTIGCEQHPLAKKEIEAAKFAYNNVDAISTDMAAGQGEYVSGLAKAMGCSDAAVPAFNQMAQKNYKQIMNSNTNSGLDMYENVKTEIKKDAVLASSCSV